MDASSAAFGSVSGTDGGSLRGKAASGDLSTATKGVVGRIGSDNVGLAGGGACTGAGEDGIAEGFEVTTVGVGSGTTSHASATATAPTTAATPSRRHALVLRRARNASETVSSGLGGNLAVLARVEVRGDDGDTF